MKLYLSTSILSESTRDGGVRLALDIATGYIIRRKAFGQFINTY